MRPLGSHGGRRWPCALDAERTEALLLSAAPSALLEEAANHAILPLVGIERIPGATRVNEGLEIGMYGALRPRHERGVGQFRQEAGEL